METVEQAKSRHGQLVLLLRLSAIAYVQAYGGSAPMKDVLEHLQKLTRSDPAISRALSGLLSEKRLHMTLDRLYVLPEDV